MSHKCLDCGTVCDCHKGELLDEVLCTHHCGAEVARLTAELEEAKREIAAAKQTPEEAIRVVEALESLLDKHDEVLLTSYTVNVFGVEIGYRSWAAGTLLEALEAAKEAGND